MEYTIAGKGGSIVDVNFTSCIFKRDGYGDHTTDPLLAAIKMKGFGPSGPDALQNIQFSNCRTIPGKADDAGTTTYEHPHYGVWIEDTQYVSWDGVAGGHDVPYYFGAGDVYSNWKLRLVDPKRLLDWLPTGGSGERPGGLHPAGRPFYDSTIDRPVYYSLAFEQWTDSDGRFLGSGNPNGVVSADTGARYIDTAATNGIEEWYKTEDFTNQGWKSVDPYVNAVAPASPAVGQVWIDIS